MLSLRPTGTKGYGLEIFQKVSRNYEDRTVVKKIYVGLDDYLMLKISETEDEARQRLLASIDCPYTIVEEGRGEDQSIGTRNKINVHTNQMERVAATRYHPYIWVRYRCK